jgi:hypothetical protein
MAVHYLPQAGTDHVRVDFGRGNVGMAQHRLNAAKIGAAFEQVRRKRVA